MKTKSTEQELEFWAKYNFVQDYTHGNFGIVPLQDAIDKHFEQYFEKFKNDYKK